MRYEMRLIQRVRQVKENSVQLRNCIDVKKLNIDIHKDIEIDISIVKGEICLKILREVPGLHGRPLHH